MKFSTATYFTVTLLYFFLHDSLSVKIRCYKTSFTDYEEVPLQNYEQLINSSNPCINVSACTSMFIFGFTGNPNGFAVSTLMPTLINLRKCNVLLLNWMEEASGGIFGPLLGYPLEAVPATRTVGKELGEVITKLVNGGLNKEIHMIGHSLGAHVACYAGRNTKQSGYTIPRITALDAARLEFEPAAPTVMPIDRTCATFVDAVHCDPGGYGMNGAVAHVDFWPNYGPFVNGARLQPGCTKSYELRDLAVNGNLCNHNRCIELYNVSLTETMILEGEKAKNYQAWVQSDDDDADTNFIGPLVDQRKSGKFFLSTTAVYPFGEGPAGVSPD